MNREKIVWLEIHAPEVMKREHEILPDGFSIVRPESRTDRDEHLRLVADADYIIAGGIPVTGEYIDAAKKLKMIQKWGIGVDKIDCDAARRAGVAVNITAGSNAIPVAELAVGLMLAVNRKIPYVDASVRDGRWVKAEMRSQCYMINGKTVGLLGIGNIAKRVARLLSGFEVDILYYDICRLDKEEEKARGVRYAPFDELIAASDIVSVHVPLTGETRGMIGKEAFTRMKKTAILINTARGFVVDEAALIEALQEGEIRAAGIDAFESEPVEPDNPLLTMENVVLTCHCGGGVLDNVLPVTRHAYENIEKFSKHAAMDPRDVVVQRTAS